ncbi:AlpA family transcriptional regulator [Massilia arenosa]|uniref:AlpA family transcriptional regulator n=1 Tax=Zemynaea arenosa TaxID=2561931 RepID=A0A4Y9S3V2_9BURK|nr:AlpA family transcriptional regulator [Massilia arenosa]TFW16041.1 AlpA family transcriptional regulator [Massilia arenosa]
MTIQQLIIRSGTDRRAAVSSDERLLRLPEVLKICGMSRSSLYQAIQEERFPRPLRLNARSAAWLKSDIDHWLNQLVANQRPARRGAKRG